MVASPGESMSRAISAMPQLTDALVSAGRMVPAVATVMLEGISRSCLWWKSGSTTGGAAKAAPAAPVGERRQHGRVCRRIDAVKDPRGQHAVKRDGRLDKGHIHAGA